MSSDKSIERRILHVDMDAFYASVEQRDDPALRNRPVIVGGRPGQRGVVAACSYEARAHGIHSAMPSSTAAKRCPEAVFVKPRFDAYRRVSKQVREIFSSVTDKVEPLSLDEAYLDVGHVVERFGSATAIAKHIKLRIHQELRLTASAGISFNKFLAKVASDVNKPDGIYVITPQAADEFLAGLPIRKFFGVGKVTEKRMQTLGIFNGKDLRRLTRLELLSEFGSQGSYFYEVARGIDRREVKSVRKRKSLGSETTFVENQLSKPIIWATLQQLVEKIMASMDKHELLARTLTLKVRYADFRIVTRSQTLSEYYLDASDVIEQLPHLLRRTEVGSVPIRLIGVTLSNLHPRFEQEQTPSETNLNQEQLILFASKN